MSANKIKCPGIQSKQASKSMHVSQSVHVSRPFLPKEQKSK